MQQQRAGGADGGVERVREAGARGSSTTSGRESDSEISLRSIIPWPRATEGQWMREAGEPSRNGRRPSISVSAAAISAARACAGSPLPRTP